MLEQQRKLCEKKSHGRKTVRPISIRGFNHVVLKSRYYVLRRNHALVKQIIRETQLRFGMRIRALSIMENHIHVLMNAPTREAFGNAMRFLCGMIGRKLCLKMKLKPRGDGPTFFSQRIWSRVIRGWLDQECAELYVWRNAIKAGIFTELDSCVIRGGILEWG